MLSYIDLPYHLKYCFSYLSAFPEDYLIRKTKLTQLWVVKRFVEEIPVHTTEEVVEKYLNELVGGSTVQVVEKDYSNRDRTCRIHDIIRDIIQSKSRDESLLMILNDIRMSLDEKILRMLIHDSCKELPLTMRFTSLRSLLVFVSIDTSKSLRMTFFKDFRMLGVLELERALLNKFPPELVEVIHLSYVSLRKTMIIKIPESIRKLKKLEILDLKQLTLPKWITSLEYLTKLVLQESYLNDDPLKSLQGLPNLGLLKLRYAYEGEELRCNVGEYPRHKKLELEERTKAIEKHKSEGRSNACVQGTIYQIM
ncbi:hypothetical protein ACSBR1_036727 [Camellia fascicularis]